MGFSAARVLGRWLGQGPIVWYDPAFRLPLNSLESTSRLQPRRADLVLWTLRSLGGLRRRDVRAPARVSYEDLARVHTPGLLSSLTERDTLARVFAVDPSEVIVDEVLRTSRLACGATVQAARESLAGGRPSLNLLGGFHHAAPDRAAGLCPFNDVAVAIACLRGDGLSGTIRVIDLDAHPPDGTAECATRIPGVWIGSLSGCEWGQLPNVDETVLPPACGDAEYLTALDALLKRAPEAAITFVIAGGDVLAGDHLGHLGLSLDGARERDRRVLHAIAGGPSVWLPGGGYHPDAWKVLAGTGLVLSGQAERSIPDRYDPLETHYAQIARSLPREDLGQDATITAADIDEALGFGRADSGLLLGFYSAEGIEYGLFQYGISAHVHRLGYGDLKVAIDRTDIGDRMRLFGTADGRQHLLIEVVLERRPVAGRDVLYIHWLSLRHPRATFTAGRPRLPGQDAPGLGLGPEALELLAQMAARLGLAGLASSPSSYHVAYTARRRYRFVDPARQGRFEALQRDLGRRPLLSATQAVAAGTVMMNGAPYTWESDLMVEWLDGTPAEDPITVRERERVHFSVEQT